MTIAERTVAPRSSQTIDILMAALLSGHQGVIYELTDALEEVGDRRRDYFFDFLRQWAEIPEALAVAAEGCPNRQGFWPGAYRLHAVRYYAGMVRYPNREGTAPAEWLCRITDRFMEESRKRGITATVARVYAQGQFYGC